MKLPEKIKSDFESGKISHWEYQSKIFRYNESQRKKEEKEARNKQEKKLRKIRAERNKRYSQYLDESIKSLENEIEVRGLRPKRRRIAPEIIQKIYERNILNNGILTCYLCNLPVKFGDDAIDHKIPVIRGGTNDLGNLEITHARCNSKKNSKTEEEYENFRLRRK